MIEHTSESQHELERLKSVLNNSNETIRLLEQTVIRMQDLLTLTYERILVQEKEIARLKEGKFTKEEFQNLCHNFTEEDECRFKLGCEEYQRNLFGKGAIEEEREIANFEWWKALCLVDGVSPDPQSVKRWVLQMRELAVEEGMKTNDQKEIPTE